MLSNIKSRNQYMLSNIIGASGKNVISCILQKNPAKNIVLDQFEDMKLPIFVKNIVCLAKRIVSWPPCRFLYAKERRQYNGLQHVHPLKWPLLYGISDVPNCDLGTPSQTDKRHTVFLRTIMSWWLVLPSATTFHGAATIHLLIYAIQLHGYYTLYLTRRSLYA